MPSIAMRLAAASTLLLCAAAAAAPRVSGELGYGYDSNSNRARRGADERAAAQLRGTLAVETRWLPGAGAVLLLQGGFDGQHDLDYSGLSNGKLTALARLLYRGGRGFHAPTFALTGAASHWEFDSRLRDSAEYRLGGHVGAQLTTRIAARFGLSAAWREARSAVFDLDARSALLDLDWHLQPRLALYLGYQYRDGDLVSTVPIAPADPAAPYTYKAAARDDGFGRAGDWVYRVGADAQVGTLGVNYALSPQLALDAQTQFVEAESDLGTRYARWLSSLSLLFRF